MNLDILTDEQVLEFYETLDEAIHGSSGWAMSLTEHVKYQLRAFGVYDIPAELHDLHASMEKEKKEREF